jgi:hypothetical protein
MRNKKTTYNKYLGMVIVSKTFWATKILITIGGSIFHIFKQMISGAERK